MNDLVKFTLDEELITEFARLSVSRMFRRCSFKYSVAAVVCGLLFLVPFFVSRAYGLDCKGVFALSFLVGCVFFVYAVAMVVNVIRRVPPRWLFKSVREEAASRFWSALGVVGPLADLQGADCTVEFGSDSLSFSLGSLTREFDLHDVDWVVADRDMMVVGFDDGVRLLPRDWWFMPVEPSRYHYRPGVPVYIGGLDDAERKELVARLLRDA